MNGPDKKMLEREALRNLIHQWNMNRLDLFELSEPNEDLSFHGVMRFYFQDSGQKVATKCIRVASDATVSDVIETLIEKFRPDMRMLSVSSYALYELHSQEERKLSNDEKPLLVQLNWHVDDREGRFLLKNVDDKTSSAVSGTDANTNFKRKLSKREKKELKKKEKLSRIKSDAAKDDKHPVAERLYTELPETSFTRSISNPEAVMRRRRQQKLERKLQQFRSKDGGPDTGGTLKIYGESLCPDVPYKTLLLSINDCAASVVREMLDKYGLGKIDPQLYCIIQVNTQDNSEYILDDDECPLAIVMTHSQRGSIMFHVRRRPADCQPRRRKKKSGSLRAGGSGTGVGAPAGILIETQSDGTPHDNGRSVRISGEGVEVGSANGVALQLYGPSIQPRHCVLAANDGVVTLTPLHADAHTFVNGQRIFHTTILQHGCIIKFDRMSTFRYMDPIQENKLNRNISQSQNFDTGSVYDRSPTSPVPDGSSGILSPISQNAHSQLDLMVDPSGINITGDSDFQRAMSPILSSNKMGSQDNFGYNSKNHLDASDNMLAYANNNNNNVKMDTESLMLSQHLANSKADLLQESHFALPYNGISTGQTATGNKDQSGSNKNPNNQYKDNYETTFDLDGNVETKSICSAKSGGSGHENRLSRGQEAILPAVLEFPEQTQHFFLQSVITKLDVNAPAYKLAPVYTLYLCARYRASTHYRPELTPTERAHKLTVLLQHIATLIQSTVQEKYSDAAVQAFWMANSSELLHFLKCDRHISAFTVHAQEILLNTVQTAFSNLVSCFHLELSQVLTSFLEEGSSDGEESGVVIGILSSAMGLLRRCRVNAALTIQLFSQLFHYINVWCFNKVVNSSYMWCSAWGASISARLAPVGAWAERQGLEFAAECHLALIHQCANLLQAPKNTAEDVTNLTSACFKLNSVQLRCLLGGFTEETPNGIARLSPDLVEAAVKHAQGVVDELHRADGREIALEESSSLPLSLLIPEDGFSSDVMRGLPVGLTEFLTPLQRNGLCRLAPQTHSQGHWTVYMNGYNGNNVTVKQAPQPVVEIIQLQKNSNGMGLSIVAAKGAGQSKLGIYIKSVVPGGAAAADQRLQAGDQLLAVDGNSLVGITQERAAEHLVRTGPIVTLQVAKQGAVLHGLATLLRQPSPQSSRGNYYRQHRRGSYNRNPLDFHNEMPRSSSDDSLNENVGFIPRVVINFDDENGETQTFTYNDDSPEKNSHYYNRNNYESVYQPGYDNNATNVNIYNREQSVDSSIQSYDSDCSYPECMEKFDNPGRVSSTIYRRDCVEDYGNKADVKNKYSSFQVVKNSSDNSPVAGVYMLNNEYDEIPYIDDIDSEPVIFEYKSCSSSFPRGTDHIRATVDKKSLKNTTVTNNKMRSIENTIDKSNNSSKSYVGWRKRLELQNEQSSHSKDEIKHNLDCLRLNINNWKLNKTSVDPVVSKADIGNEHNLLEICNSNVVNSENSTVVSSTEVLDEIDDVQLGFGKVKALTQHFNKINLVYQSKILNRNCQSSPNLSQSNEDSSSNSPASKTMSKSLANLNDISKKTDSDVNKLSEEEQRKILLQLEDWSKNGTRGNFDGDNFIDDDPKLDDCKPDVKLRRDSMENIKSPLNKKFGSLEKLTGSLKPKVVELILRKTQSTSDICDDDIERKPAIEKTKLLMPRKKFPQSYIVRKKTQASTDAVNKNQIVQSCPNLAKSNKSHSIPHENICNNFPRISKNNSVSLGSLIEQAYVKVCRIKKSKCDWRDRFHAPRFTWIQNGPAAPVKKIYQSCEDIRPRRMSERDLPSKIEMEQSSGSGHMTNTVKSSKSVPALHEHMKQHEVFNPGYSRTSSNNSIPAMPGLKGKNPQVQPQVMQQPASDQNSFYQNLSVYRNTGLGDRTSNLRNSQNSLQLHGQTQQKNIHPEHHTVDRVSSNRPQSAYYGNQMMQTPVHNANTIRTAQSTKDLAYNNENLANYQVRGNYPSMPNVNQGYNTNIHNNSNQSFNQAPAGYHGNFNNSQNRPPMSPLSPNQQNNPISPNNPNQYPMQNINNSQGNHFANQSTGAAQNMYNNQNHFLNHGNNQIAGSNPNLRGQAKLAEMTEEVTRRQQRGPMNVYGDPNIVSPLQQKRFQYNQDGYGPSNGPMSPNVPMSPTKLQPPVAPKPQNIKREITNEVSQDIPEGPPLPPPVTHPLYHQPPNEDDGSYLASSCDPPAVSYYPTHRPGQTSQAHFPPNPWEREEREKELEARRVAGRVWRDQQIAGLQSLGEERRTPQQEQQLRALTLERDFERRAQETQIDDEEKEIDNRTPKAVVAQPSGLLRLANNNVNNPPPDLNLVSVGSNIVSSIQPVSVAISNSNGGEQQQDNTPPSQQENRMSQQPPPMPSIQPKSILKSNLRLDNLNSNSPQSPSKSQKNASFSANLTPQNLKFDTASKYDSKYDYNINNKYDAGMPSKYDSNHPKYTEPPNMAQPKYDQQYAYNVNNNLTSSKYDTNPSNVNVMSPNQLTQAMGDLYVNSSMNYNSRLDSTNSNTRYDHQQYVQDPAAFTPAPPPPERGSSFVVMSQQQAIRSNVSTSNTLSLSSQNMAEKNNTMGLKDKRVSFHDNDHLSNLVITTNNDNLESEMEPIMVREDPDRFIMEAENMLQSPSTPTGSNVTHTPGVIGAQEFYRDPRQKRLAEQQKAQQAGATPIPEKLSFKEKMKMFALESGESNTPKDKVKISRAQRDIDAVH